MSLLLGLALLAALILWLSRPPRKVEPGDAIHPVDPNALAEAEEDLKEGAEGPRAEGPEADWGPGAPR